MAPGSLILTQLPEFAAAFKQPCDRRAAEVFQLLPWAMISEEIQNGVRHRELGLQIIVNEIIGVMPGQKWFEPYTVSPMS